MGGTKSLLLAHDLLVGVLDILVVDRRLLVLLVLGNAGGERGVSNGEI